MRGFGHRIGDSLRVPGRGVRRLLLVLAALVLAGAVGIAVSVSVPAVGQRLGLAAGAPTTEPPPPPVDPQPALLPLTPDSPPPTAAGLTRLLGPLTAAGLGTHGATVIDPATGRTLWSQDASRPLAPASTGKLLAAAAALLTLGQQTRLHTTVVAGATPGTVVLVGGGDPTLSALPAGETSVYPGAARLDDLAAQVRAAVRGPVTEVVVDVGRYVGPGLAPGWMPSDIPAGNIAPIVPLMLDGGRADPTAVDGARTATPAQVAGRELARRLGVPDVPVTLGTAPAGAAVLGSVASPTIPDLVDNALRISDNVLAECLAREVAIATGHVPSFAGSAAAVAQVLERHGFDVSGARMVDGSGLSTEDRVPPALLGQVLSTAAGPADARGAALRPLLDGLPVAGGTGTLGDRFLAGTPNAAGRGYVRAKTGTLTGVSSLAGVVSDMDGRLLVFAVMENGVDAVSARPRLDAVASALRGCGCR